MLLAAEGQRTWMWACPQNNIFFLLKASLGGDLGQEWQWLAMVITVKTVIVATARTEQLMEHNIINQWYGILCHIAPDCYRRRNSPLTPDLCSEPPRVSCLCWPVNSSGLSLGSHLSGCSSCVPAHSSSQCWNETINWPTNLMINTINVTTMMLR